MVVIREAGLNVNLSAVVGGSGRSALLGSVGRMLI